MDAITFWTVLSIGVMSLLSAVLLVDRTVQGKDLSLLARAIPRFYIAIACLLFLIWPTEIDRKAINIGFFMLLFADSLVAIFYLAGKKYRDEAETQLMISLLEKTHSRYVSVLENCQIGFFVIDLKGRMEYANQAFLRMMGVDKIGLLDNSIFNYIPAGKNTEKVKENMNKKIVGDTSVTCYETELLRTDGSVMPVRVASYNTQNGHPTITGSIIPLSLKDYDCMLPKEE
jgi:PAS domain S-box-containing protein